MIAVRKLKLTIINEDEKLRKEQYQFLRDSQYNQYKALNRAMSYLATAFLSGDSEAYKEARKSLTNTSECFKDISFGKGIDSASQVTQKVKKDIASDIKNGLAKGDRSVRNYKRTVPLITRGRDLKFYEENGEIFIKWVNKIVFKVVTGRKDKDYLELQHTLNKILVGEYKICTSSIQALDKLILNLTLDIPQNTKNSYVENRVLGIDMGIKYPLYASLSDVAYIKSYFGHIDEFLNQRIQFDKRRRKVQEQLKNVPGGKGRKDKLKALESFRQAERNWVKTYNHALSKRVVEFAKKHQCQFIHLEKLTAEGFDTKLLRNWSYYELQQMIKYKAEREGIQVRYVEAAYTSQQCSICGHTDKENREDQETFICKSCGFTANADYNASQNIAKSANF